MRIALWLSPIVAVCGWFAVIHTQHATLPGSGAVLETSNMPLAIQLQDGSSLELAAQTRLRVLRDQPSAVELEIGDGRASFDVTHVKGRAFDVRAGVVTVHVVGTQFQVVKATRREGTEIQVAVKRGVVAVQRSDRDGDTRRIAAGETWSVWVPAEPDVIVRPQPTAAALPVNEPDPSADAVPVSPVKDPHAAVAEPQAEPESAQPTVETRAPARSNSMRARSPRQPTAAASSAQPEKRVVAEDVRALFMRANVARRAGRMQDAANAYDEVLKRFPHDSRAGVCAFELGRIRMDALADPKGAASAFADALRLSRRAELREDALARLAIASDATGDREICQSARARYLADYPSGVHVGSLTPLCGGSAR